MSILKNNNNAPIAFFDSGIGGLTVYDKVKQLLPNENYIYYGDTLHMPYGEKTKEQLLHYSDKIFRFFESQNCKAVVMACNTTSSVIFDDVNEKYNFKLYPIVQSVSEILSKLEIRTLGVFATRATIESKAYEKCIAKYNNKMRIFGQYCPKWVHIVEKNAMHNPENIEIIKSDLEKMMKNKPERIILGCTHYPFLAEVLGKFINKEILIDPAIYFANYIKSDLEKFELLKDPFTTGFEKFYVSSNPDLFRTSAQMFYKLQKSPEILTFEN